MIPALIMGGMSLAGGIMGARAQARQQREASRLQQQQLNLQREGLDFARGQYADRGRYRDLLPGAIGDIQRAGRADYTERDNFRPLESKYTSQYDDAIAGLTGDSGRLQRIQDAMREYDAIDGLEYDQRVKSTAGDAARLGRLGSGQTAKDVTDLGAEFALRRDAQRNQLIRDAVEGDLNDRYKLVDVTGRRNAEDLALGQANRAERRQLGLDADARASQRASQASALASLLSGLGYGGAGEVSSALERSANGYGTAANNAWARAQQSGQSAGQSMNNLGQLAMMYFGRGAGGMTPPASTQGLHNLNFGPSTGVWG